MNCTNFESDIALLAGGDLAAGDAARVEQHLALCRDCRALAEQLQAGRELLGELRDDPLADLMAAQVRRRVMAEIGAARPSRLYWKLALAAALILAAVAVWPRHRPKPAAAAARMAAPQIAAAPTQAAAPNPARRKRRRRAPAVAPGEPLLVQIVTSNPNIVIYWLVDAKPQGD